MDILNDIQTHLAQGQELSKAWLEQAQERYPYFLLPALLYLKQHGIKGNDDLLDRLALVSPDRMALASQLGNQREIMSKFYPEEEKKASADTVSAIDQFLDSFGTSTPKEIEVLNNAIFNPTPDYADLLAAQEREEAQDKSQNDDELQNMTRDDELINRFIARSIEKERKQSIPAPQQHVEAAEIAEIADTPIDEPKAEDESMLSESLAKMYISRRKYAKALEIIEHINLKFPEKSIYFADQIRFLRKLVLNEQTKNTK